MSRRSKVPRSKSRKQFTRTAGNKHMHPKNGMGHSPIMRGGIRL